ncbi:MAG: arginine--tRNA ligase [Chloroflexi bacterium]|nr:arginine--tRNA ligase [Chloroflexota bacterium]
MIRDQIAELITRAIKRAQKADALPAFDVPAIEIGRTKDATHGDYTSSVAMQSARLARMAPMLIGQAIVKHLRQADFLSAVEVVPPGFINFRLNDAWLTGQVTAIEAAAGHYGDIDLRSPAPAGGQGKTCQVEFISANPTGPLHVGSARNAVVGDVLARVLAAAGWQVQREYYVNDAGTQMRTFAETLYRRYLQAFGQDAALESHHYQGAYMLDLARDVVTEHGDRFLAMPAEDAISALSEIGLEKMLVGIQKSAAGLRIQFDNWFSERSLYESGGTFGHVMARLTSAGLTELRDGAVWLRTSAFGSDRDEVLIRSTGQPGYYASDVAYHYDKFVMRGFDRVIDVWAVDHQNQARRMPHLMKALGLDPDRLTIVLYDFVRLYREGQEVKLSKRSGDIITVDEVTDEVGTDAVRFLLLTRSNQAVMDFDLNLAVQQNDENPVYYVQYAYARMSSILRVAEERGFGPAQWHEGDPALLSHPAELTLLRKMAELPEVIEKAALNLAPHHLAFYALDLAGIFHAFYRDCRVISSEPAEAGLTCARLRLVAATRAVFARVLELMGVSAPETM